MFAHVLHTDTKYFESGKPGSEITSVWYATMNAIILFKNSIVKWIMDFVVDLMTSQLGFKKNN